MHTRTAELGLERGNLCRKMKMLGIGPRSAAQARTGSQRRAISRNSSS